MSFRNSDEKRAMGIREEQEILNREQSKAKAIEALMSSSPELTDLSEEQINYLTVMQAAADYAVETYGDDCGYQTVIDWFIRYRVSKTRRGRKEISDISRPDAEEMAGGGIKGRLQRLLG